MRVKSDEGAPLNHQANMKRIELLLYTACCTYSNGWCILHFFCENNKRLYFLSAVVWRQRRAAYGA